MDRLAEALALDEGGAFLDKRDCGSLEALMIEYVNVGELENARGVLHVFLERCNEWELADRVRDFARRRLTES